ncbi:MAG: hypothetical protein P8Z68_08425, partial [Kineosporiaceae bacterium]
PEDPTRSTRIRQVEVWLGRERYLLRLSGDTRRLGEVLSARLSALRARRPESGGLVEVPLADRVAVLRAYLLPSGAYRRRRGRRSRASESRFHFGYPGRPSLDDIRALAEGCAVFRVTGG